MRIGLAIAAALFCLLSTSLSLQELRVVAACGLILTVVTTHGTGWLSPPLLLGLSALTFYSLLPAAMAPAILGTDPLHPTLDIAPHNLADISTYLGSPAEALVLQFGLLLLATHLTIQAWRPRALWQPVALPRGSDGILSFLLVSVILSCWTLRLSAATGQLAAMFHHLLPPVAAIAATALTAHAKATRRGRSRAYILVGSTLLSLVAAWHGKIPVFILVSLFLMHMANSNNNRQVFVVMAIATIVGALSLTLIDRVRYPASPPLSQPALVAARAAHVLANKVVIRQVETGACFARLVAKQGERPFDIASQAYLPIALIPRALWPDKPSLSEGGRYMRDYCDVPQAEVGPGSASITLLGQPVEKGGRASLLVAEAILVMLFAGIMKALHRGGITAIIAVALLPWLVDFDQDFALYTANAVKTAMTMLAVIGAVLGTIKLWQRRESAR